MHYKYSYITSMLLTYIFFGYESELCTRSVFHVYQTMVEWL